MLSDMATFLLFFIVLLFTSWPAVSGHRHPFKVPDQTWPTNDEDVRHGSQPTTGVRHNAVTEIYGLVASNDRPRRTGHRFSPITGIRGNAVTGIYEPIAVDRPTAGRELSRAVRHPKGEKLLRRISTTSGNRYNAVTVNPYVLKSPINNEGETQASSSSAVDGVRQNAVTGIYGTVTGDYWTNTGNQVPSVAERITPSP